MTEASQGSTLRSRPVSTAINQLEKALGAPLFVRQHSEEPRADVGRREPAPRDRGDLRTHHRCCRLDQAGQREVRGTIVIACFQTIAPFLLPQLLQRLGRTVPELSVEVVEGDHEEKYRRPARRAGRTRSQLRPHRIRRHPRRDRRRGPIRTSSSAPITVWRGGRRSRSPKLADDAAVVLDLPDSRGTFSASSVGRNHAARALPQLEL